jgi:hypothetical protein
MSKHQFSFESKNSQGLSLFGHENDEMNVKKLNIHFFIFLKKALIVLCGKHEKFDSKYVGSFLTCHSSRSLTRYFFSLFLIRLSIRYP